MGTILTEDMRRVAEAELGFIATVCPDGTPNLSPKGTTAVWGEDHLVFADLRSPGTGRRGLARDPPPQADRWRRRAETSATQTRWLWYGHYAGGH